MIAFHIRHGADYWTADEAGRITRPGIVVGSDSWRVLGAVRLNNFGAEVQRYTLDDIKRGGIAWQHKNGAQRVYIIDFDHGTRRMWGSPSHAVWPAAESSK